MLTIPELARLLALNCDPDELLQILDISAEEICDRFQDKIEEQYEELIQDFEEQEEGED